MLNQNLLFEISLAQPNPTKYTQPNLTQLDLNQNLLFEISLLSLDQTDPTQPNLIF